MEFGLIGEHLSHSFSATIHGIIGAYGYALTEVAPADLASFLTRRDFRGVNVTIPYKESVIPYLDELSPEARRIGAVNTIINNNGRLIGYNTDYQGFAMMANRTGVNFAGKRVLILGRGGAAKAVAAVAADSGAVSIITTGRNTDFSASCIGRDFDILVNATPLGMYPDADNAIPFDIGEFAHLDAVLDCVYNPLCTNLVIQAKLAGIPADGGLYMLVAQAVKASELFCGNILPAETADTIFHKLISEKQNTVIIGMPSCGKTTYARRLSQETGRAFVDTDSLIEEKAGKSIPQIFAEDGEPTFRRIESEVIDEVSRWQGCIIATGGGAVLNPANMLRLKRNGRVIYLQADLAVLKTGGNRPLSSDVETLERMYAERHPLYMKYADSIV